MPKQVYKLDQFHGGLNSNSDPRDVTDNEFSAATDLMVDELGKIRTMGNIASHVSGSPEDDMATGFTGTISAGYGLFQFSSDRTGAEDAGTTEAETGDDYLAMYDGNDGQVWVYSRAADIWNDDVAVNDRGVIDIGSSNTSTANPSFYYADGALRVSDGNFANSNETKWYGYVYRRFFGDGSTGYEEDDYGNGLLVSTWHEDEVALKSLAVKDFYGGVQSNGTDPDISSPISVQFQGTTTHYQDVLSSGTIADDTQSIRIRVAFSASEPNVTALTNTTPGFDTFCSAGDHILVEEADDAGNNRIFKVKGVSSDDTDPNTINFEETVTACTTDDCYMYNLTRSSWFNSENTGWECAVSTLYDDSKQESPLSIASGTLEPDDIVETTYNMSEMSINLHVFAGDGASTGLALIHSRVSGFKIYMRRSDTSTWYLQKEIDITKGIRAPGQGDYVMWGDSTIMGGESAPAEGNNESSPRQVETYESETGYDASATKIGFDGAGTGYKTAVVTNRTAYVGNVRIPDWKGDIKNYGDAILKSQVNKFDSFTFERRVEVEISDGDEIVKLEEYADRILQFKKKKMHLINVSQEIEFLEDSFSHKGVSHPDATCKTDFGIAWVNDFGCYLYDGQKVNNLLEKGGRQIIKESDWSSFITDNSIIGYIPQKRQLLVLKDCTATSAGDTFLYDIVTQSWVEGDSKTTDTQKKTNFVVDWNGDLVFAEVSGVRLVDELSPTHTAWQASQSHSDVEQTSTDGVGTGIKCDIATNGSGAATFTIVSAGGGYIVDEEIVFTDPGSTSSTATIVVRTLIASVSKWSDTSVATTGLSLNIKDIDFGHPSIRKKIYKAYVSYKGDGSGVTIAYAVNGDNNTTASFYRTTADGSTDGTNSDTTPLLDVGTDDWVLAELKPVSSINNVYSFQLQFSGTAASDFEINDISIVYRLKKVR